MVRRWKTLAQCLGAVALVLTVVFACLVAGTRLQVTVTGETIVPASEEPERFEEVMREMRYGALPEGCQYGPAAGEEIEEYAFVALELSVRSFGLLPCEWIRARVSPLEGDIALASDALPDMRFVQSKTTRLWILCRADAAQTGHSAWIEYYALGVKTYADAKYRAGQG